MCGYTHLSVYSGISLCHRQLYTWLCVTVRGYTCIFTLKASIYTVLQHSHFTMWLHTWLYHFMCGYTLNTWLYTFIYTLTFHCITVSRYTVIPIISRIYTYIHVIYTYVIVPYIVSLFQHRPSQSTLARYFYTYICTYTVVYQTTLYKSCTVCRMTSKYGDFSYDLSS